MSHEIKLAAVVTDAWKTDEMGLNRPKGVPTIRLEAKGSKGIVEMIVPDSHKLGDKATIIVNWRKK